MSCFMFSLCIASLYILRGMFLIVTLWAIFRPELLSQLAYSFLEQYAWLLREAKENMILRGRVEFCGDNGWTAFHAFHRSGRDT